MKHFLLSLFFVAVVCVMPQAVRAQVDIVPAGGSSPYSLTGSVECSWGQVFCDYGNPTPDYYMGEGVQQPYPENIIGCDTVYATESQAACDNYAWHSYVLDRSGVYTDTLTSAAGCDSIVELTLTILYSPTRYDTAQTGTNYYYHGHSYIESGNYRVQVAAGGTCDSVYQLHLSVLRSAPLPHIKHYNRQIIVVDHYPDGEGTARAEYSYYRWYRNGVLITSTPDDYITDYRDGKHQQLTGCFYVEVPAGDGFWVHSNTICLDAAKAAAQPVSFVLYPNPVAAGAVVTVQLAHVPEASLLEVYDLTGRQLSSAAAADGDNFVTAPLAAGTYSVVLRMPNDQTMLKKLVVR